MFCLRRLLRYCNVFIILEKIDTFYYKRIFEVGFSIMPANALASGTRDFELVLGPVLFIWDSKL